MICYFVNTFSGTIILFLLISMSLNGDGQISEDYSEETCMHRLMQNNPIVAVRFSTEQLKGVCKREKMWLEMSRKSAGKAVNSLLSPKQTEWLNYIYSCQDLLCLCKLDAKKTCDSLVKRVNDTVESSKQMLGNAGVGLDLGGNWKKRTKRQLRNKLVPVVRKEYRMLTNDERRRFHAAMNSAKSDLIDGLSKYDILTVYHTPEHSPGAHFGPALLPFHRELLKQLEVTLRAYDVGVGLPYWDTTLDQPLPKPADSVLWTKHFFGNGDGEVSTGPFSEWRSINDSQLEQLSPNRAIMRSVGAHPNGGLFRPDDVERFNEQEDFQSMTYCVDPFLELLHGTVHMWVGGHMGEMRISSNDPTFFVFHSHLDYLWEQWRQSKQTAEQRQQQYPTDEQSCNKHHYKDSQMKPFFMKNGEGLSNRYTDTFYSYDPAPTCSEIKADCGSEWLFCDIKARKPRCVSKVVVGGDCTGFESQDICHQGRCVGGRCKALPNVEQETPAAATTTETSINFNLDNSTISTSTISTSTVATSTISTSTVATSTISSAPTTVMTTSSESTITGAAEIVTISVTHVTHGDPLRTTSTKPITRRPFEFITLPSEDDSKSVWFPITVVSLLNTTGIASFPSASVISENRDTNQRLDGAFGSPNNWPYYEGSAFAQVSSPFHSPTGHTVSDIIVVDEKSQPCVSMCLVNRTIDPSQYIACKAVVTLDTNPQNSDNIAFTPFKDQARHLNWKGGKKIPDQFMFICHKSAKKSAISSTTVQFQNQPVKQPAAFSVDETKIGKEETVNLPVIRNSTVDNVNNSRCFNQHKCCALWASVGECGRNPWMRLACPKSCSVCINTQQNSDSDCNDYFGDCAKWTAQGKCAIRANWMEENCQKSCDKCNRSNSAMETECGVGSRSGECKDKDDRCYRWAKRGECLKNPWWMEQNCPLACRICVI